MESEGKDPESTGESSSHTDIEPEPELDERAPASRKEPSIHANEETRLVQRPFDTWLYTCIKSGWLYAPSEGVPGMPLYGPPAAAVCLVICAVFGIPACSHLFGSGSWAFPTPGMVKYFAIYMFIDFGLRLILSMSKWGIMIALGFSHEEVKQLCGRDPDIPTDEFISRGGRWLYRIDSFGRKLPHVLHWAGLAHFTTAATHDTWSAFQFAVMGATMDSFAMLLCLRTTSFFVNMWIWLSVVRTADGYARRMNNVYTTTASISGMGCVVPLCSHILGHMYATDDQYLVAAFLFIITYPCAYGDCLAEIIGVNGVLRFPVYGIGEINNKSVEGMLAMFAGSVIPSLPYAWAVGGLGWLCFIGVLATLAETWSPRGFDNICIPAASTVGVAIARMYMEAAATAANTVGVTSPAVIA